MTTNIAVCRKKAKIIMPRDFIDQEVLVHEHNEYRSLS